MRRIDRVLGSAFLFAAAAAAAAVADTYTVTAQGESGAGSIGAAIASANASPGLDTIEFDRQSVASGELLKVKFTVTNIGTATMHSQEPQASRTPDGRFYNDGRDGRPDDAYVYDTTSAEPPKQFNLIHGLNVSKDGIVYVSDASNSRVQSFRKSGEFLAEVVIDPEHAAAVSNFARYANGVLGSEKFMDAELLEAPEIVIPAGAPDPEFVPPCADEVIRLYDRIWTNLLR